MLLRIYAKCIHGQDAIARRRMIEVLCEDAPDMLPPVTETDEDTNDDQGRDYDEDQQP